MDCIKANEIDSQIPVESVSFLDNCFDNSFTLHNSLLSVKEYAAVTQIERTVVKESKTKSKKPSCSRNSVNDLTLNLTITPDVSKNKDDYKHVRDLKQWGLPQEIVNNYKLKGITEMFEWQVSCLSKPEVLLHYRNLVYSAPTSAGKTLVAEILTIKTILERQKKVLIILPFVSIVREKMFYLQDILSSSGIRVEGFMGSQSPPGGLQAVHVAICTIEKANSLVNRLLDEGTVSELGAVVVDELHLLGDSHRGYILELLLTKIKYMTSKANEVNIQIIGMSATLPNLEVLASWLDAELFVTDYRPIPLEEYCLVGNKFFNRDGDYLRSVNIDIGVEKDNESVIGICLETIKDGCSILIFCMTKNRCENLAQGIASTFFKLGCTGNEMGVVLRNQLKSENIVEVLEQLKNCPVGLDGVLKNIVSFGVAYHHAGLTFDERDIIEGAFKSGAIRVLVATSTLSSGVNLPARKVIIRTPVFQKQPINILTYKQMIGRAGRMGRDIKGESILICTESEKKIGLELMAGALQPVKSCIESEDRYMRAVLEIIASQVACTKEELDLYSKCSLLFNQEEKSDSQMLLLRNTLDSLKSYELVRVQNIDNGEQYVATSLGKACLSSSMAPNDGLSLFCELQKARQCIVLENDLHLIYLVTPYSVSSQWSDIDWLHLLTLWESLTQAMKKVGELVGVQESFIVQRLRGSNKTKVSQNKLNIHKRFYTALALQDLVNEVPLFEVARKFQCARGFLQGLQQAAATFAGMVTAFCRQLGWKNMELLISQFQDRLHFGIHSELIELMKLSSLNGLRARALFDGGFETISDIATGDVHVIENILIKAIPFQSEKEREYDDENDLRKRNKIKNIWITGNCGMTANSAAQNLIVEARKYLQLEIGVTEIKWKEFEGTMPLDGNSNVNGDAKEEYCLIQTLSNNWSPEKSPKVNGEKQRSINETQKTKNVEGFTSSNNEPSIETHLGNTNSRLVENVPANINQTNYSEICLVDNDIEIETTQRRDITIINKNTTSLTESPSILQKEDIIWESLNITSALDNISKIRRMSDKTFSPEISFGENLNSSLDICTSIDAATVKDVSLFSSDENDSNMFDETLPIELIPNTIECNREKSVEEKRESKLNMTAHNISIDAQSILNAFTSSLAVHGAEEDIKLVYEDDKKEAKRQELNASQDIEIINSQEAERPFYTNYVSPYKRLRDLNSATIQPSPKKIRMALNENIQPELNCMKSIKFTIQIEENILNCYVLKESDSLLYSECMQSNEASIYLNIVTSVPTEIIGSNIIQKSEASKPSASNTDLVLGMAICSTENLCVYFDFTSSNDLKTKINIGKWLSKDCLKMNVLSLKTIYHHLRSWFDCNMTPHCRDLSLAEWLSQSDEKIRDIYDLVKRYCDIDLCTAPIRIGKKTVDLKKLDPVEMTLLKAWCVTMIAEKQQTHLLGQYKNINDIIRVEMHVSMILAKCEYDGLVVDRDLAAKLLIDVKNSQETLQKKAYKLCGYRFNFNSSKDVAKVLGIYKGRKVSTKKSILTAYNSPMASIVIYWRKLNAILTKTLYPLTEKASIYNSDNRISPSYTMHTCTGRVTMREPNLQNVPRTFCIPLKYLTLSTENELSSDVIEYNCRNVFKAANGCVLVSADYCQLEMRILTHYSRDPVLTGIMTSDVDVFRAIAASWSCVSEDEVDDDLRQKAKQLCYGILYGMGNKTLSQHLDVTEAEAAVFMDSFYKTYPAVKAFTQSIVENCRKNGYVETLKGRRRYLPEINSTLAFKRSAAERQAVNTTIQGSAADIAKAAMCAIDAAVASHEEKPKLILQMHDELIYEVPQRNHDNFAKVLKTIMEDTIRLNVPLPVKVKSGPTWGTLNEITVDYM